MSSKRASLSGRLLKDLCEMSRDELWRTIDPVRARFFLASVLDGLRPGQALGLPGHLVEFAWPPLSGPPLDRTTSQRIRDDLSEGNHLAWSMDLGERTYAFRRPASDCPLCGGLGYRRILPAMPVPVDVPAPGPQEVTHYLLETITCDHSEDA